VDPQFSTNFSRAKVRELFHRKKEQEERGAGDRSEERAEKRKHKSVMRRYSAHVFHNPHITVREKKDCDALYSEVHPSAVKDKLHCWERVGTGDPEIWENLIRHAGYNL
jgi:hypothetical protein